MQRTHFALDLSTSFPHNRAMADYLVGFLLALAVLGVASGLRMVLGMVQDGRRMAADAINRVEAYGKKGGSSAAVQDIAQRLAALERTVAGIDLAILDTAEKVAARLSDRERKRKERAAPAEEAELDDDAAWWARARAAHPLPGMPADPAQLPLMAMAEDEQ